jgi:hypothetical protein
MDAWARILSHLRHKGMLLLDGNHSTPGYERKHQDLIVLVMSMGYPLGIDVLCNFYSDFISEVTQNGFATEDEIRYISFASQRTLLILLRAKFSNDSKAFWEWFEIFPDVGFVGGNEVEWAEEFLQQKFPIPHSILFEGNPNLKCFLERKCLAMEQIEIKAFGEKCGSIPHNDLVGNHKNTNEESQMSTEESKNISKAKINLTCVPNQQHGQGGREETEYQNEENNNSESWNAVDTEQYCDIDRNTLSNERIYKDSDIIEVEILESTSENDDFIVDSMDIEEYGGLESKKKDELSKPVQVLETQSSRNFTEDTDDEGYKVMEIIDSDEYDVDIEKSSQTIEKRSCESDDLANEADIEQFDDESDERNGDTVDEPSYISRIPALRDAVTDQLKIPVRNDLASNLWDQTHHPLETEACSEKGYEPDTAGREISQAEMQARLEKGYEPDGGSQVDEQEDLYMEDVRAKTIYQDSERNERFGVDKDVTQLSQKSLHDRLTDVYEPVIGYHNQDDQVKRDKHGSRSDRELREAQARLEKGYEPDTAGGDISQAEMQDRFEKGYEPDTTAIYTEEEVSEAIATEEEDNIEEQAKSEYKNSTGGVSFEIQKPSFQQSWTLSDDMDAADDFTEAEQGAESSEIEESISQSRCDFVETPSSSYEACSTLIAFAHEAQNRIGDKYHELATDLSCHVIEKVPSFPRYNNAEELSKKAAPDEKSSASEVLAVESEHVVSTITKDDESLKNFDPKVSAYYSKSQETLVKNDPSEGGNEKKYSNLNFADKVLSLSLPPIAQEGSLQNIPEGTVDIGVEDSDCQDSLKLIKTVCLPQGNQADSSCLEKSTQIGVRVDDENKLSNHEPHPSLIQKASPENKLGKSSDSTADHMEISDKSFDLRGDSVEHNCEIMQKHRLVKEDKVIQDDLIEDEIVQGEVIQDDAIEHEVIQDDAIEHEVIQDDAIEPEVIQDDAIEHEVIQDDAIEHEVIQDEDIEHEGIQDDDIQVDDIEHEVIQDDDIELEVIQDDDIQVDAIEHEVIEEEVIQDDDIEEEVIQDDDMKEGVIQDDAIEEEVIRDDAIEEEVIQDEAIEEEVIQDEAIEEEVIQDAIEDEVIQDDAIEDDAIQDDVNEDEVIQDDAIEEEVIQYDAIEAEVIQDDAIQDEVIQDNAIENEVIQDDAIKDEVIQNDVIRHDVIQDEVKCVMRLENLEYEKGNDISVLSPHDYKSDPIRVAHVNNKHQLCEKENTNINSGQTCANVLSSEVRLDENERDYIDIFVHNSKTQSEKKLISKEEKVMDAIEASFDDKNRDAVVFPIVAVDIMEDCDALTEKNLENNVISDVKNKLSQIQKAINSINATLLPSYIPTEKPGLSGNEPSECIDAERCDLSQHRDSEWIDVSFQHFNDLSSTQHQMAIDQNPNGDCSRLDGIISQPVNTEERIADRGHVEQAKKDSLKELRKSADSVSADNAGCSVNLSISPALSSIASSPPNQTRSKATRRNALNKIEETEALQFSNQFDEFSVAASEENYIDIASSSKLEHDKSITESQVSLIDSRKRDSSYNLFNKDSLKSQTEVQGEEAKSKDSSSKPSLAGVRNTKHEEVESDIEERRIRNVGSDQFENETKAFLEESDVSLQDTNILLGDIDLKRDEIEQQTRRVRSKRKNSDASLSKRRSTRARISRFQSDSVESIDESLVLESKSTRENQTSGNCEKQRHNIDEEIDIPKLSKISNKATMIKNDDQLLMTDAQYREEDVMSKKDENSSFSETEINQSKPSVKNQEIPKQVVVSKDEGRRVERVKLSRTLEDANVATQTAARSSRKKRKHNLLPAIDEKKKESTTSDVEEIARTKGNSISSEALAGAIPEIEISRKDIDAEISKSKKAKKILRPTQSSSMVHMDVSTGNREQEIISSEATDSSSLQRKNDRTKILKRPRRFDDESSVQSEVSISKKSRAEDKKREQKLSLLKPKGEKVSSQSILESSVNDSSLSTRRPAKDLGSINIRGDDKRRRVTRELVVDESEKKSRQKSSALQGLKHDLDSPRTTESESECKSLTSRKRSKNDSDIASTRRSTRLKKSSNPG